MLRTFDSENDEEEDAIQRRKEERRRSVTITRGHIAKLFPSEEDGSVERIMAGLQHTLDAPETSGPEDPLAATTKMLNQLQQSMIAGHYEEVDMISNKLALNSLKAVNYVPSHTKVGHARTYTVTHAHTVTHTRTHAHTHTRTHA